jgi:hypothetical protein
VKATAIAYAASLASKRRRRRDRIARGMELVERGHRVGIASLRVYSDPFGLTRACIQVLGAAPTRLRGTDWRTRLERAA